MMVRIMGKVKRLWEEEQEKLWKQAEETVLRVRGSYDAPGFDACVKAEFDELNKETNYASR